MFLKIMFLIRTVYTLHTLQNKMKGLEYWSDPPAISTPPDWAECPNDVLLSHIYVSHKTSSKLISPRCHALVLVPWALYFKILQICFFRTAYLSVDFCQKCCLSAICFEKCWLLSLANNGNHCQGVVTCLSI